MELHDRFESQADLYAAGALNDDERRAVDEHAAACANCGAVLRDATAFAGWAGRAVADDAPPADLEDRIVAALPGRRRRLRLRVPRFLKVAAGVAAVFGFVVLGAAFTAPGSLQRMVSADSDFRGNDITGAITTPASEGTVAYDMQAASGTNYYKPDSPKGIAMLGGEGSGGRAPEKAEVERLKEFAKKAPESKPTNSRRMARLAAKPAAPPAPRDAAWKMNTGKGTPALGFTPRFQEGRKVIRRATLDLEVESYDAASEKINAIVAEGGGYVAGADTQRLANGKIRATVTLRIPPEKFNDTLLKLRGLGKVQSQNISSEDITKAYTDLKTRLASKELLMERLRKILSDAKGTVKELLSVEVQIGKTHEEIESIKGQIKYYDNLVGLSTIKLILSEKDLGRPFEYVETLKADMALTVEDPDAAYARVRKEIGDAGGKIVDAKMTRKADGSATGFVRGRIDAAKFPPLRETLRTVGHVTTDTVDRQRTARGGDRSTPSEDAPVKVEEAVFDVRLATPKMVVTRKASITVEAPDVEATYLAARKAVEATGGKITGGSLNAGTYSTQATVMAQVDADAFKSLVEKLKTGGEVKDASVQQILPPTAASGREALFRRKAQIQLTLNSPPRTLREEHGVGRMIRETFAGSLAGILWSIEKLFVGVSLALPWLIVPIIAWLIWRRRRQHAPNQTV